MSAASTRRRSTRSAARLGVHLLALSAQRPGRSTQRALCRNHAPLLRTGRVVLLVENASSPSGDRMAVQIVAGATTAATSTLKRCRQIYLNPSVPDRCCPMVWALLASRLNVRESARGQERSTGGCNVFQGSSGRRPVSWPWRWGIAKISSHSFWRFLAAACQSPQRSLRR
jgi:hypothetical protein